MNNILEIKNLNKNYNNFKLTDINLSLPKGKIIGLIGENGSGKTTTIKAIIDAVRIDEGNIKIFNKDHRSLSKKDKENIGVVLDDAFLSNNFKIDEINNILKNIYSNHDEKLFYKYVSEFKLPRDKMIKEFSNGMKMKIKLICALSHKPKLLLLDEPTNGLDPVIRYDILNMFSEYIKDTNNSILISSHITTDLDFIADEVIFIDNGKILLDIDKKELFDKYKIVNIDIKDFKNIEKDKYVKYLKYKDVYTLMIDSKDIKYYKKYEIKNINIENMMLMLIRGEE